jgi:glycosyltransferase involved in cell wall biosynthesis
MKMRRVLIVAYYFPPIGGGGVQRTVKFVRYLRDFGYEPVVLTGPGGAQERWAPEDATLAADTVGTEIHRVPGPEPALTAGWKRRAERFLDLTTPFASWWNEGVVRLGREVVPTVEVIIGELVPYFTAEPVRKLSEDMDVPWVADLQDPWALDEMWLYPTFFHRYRDLRRMRRALESADVVIMNTPEAAARVARRLPTVAEKLGPAIPNGLDSSDYGRATQVRARRGTFRIAHSGYLHTEDGLKHRRARRVREFLGGAPVRGVDILPRSHVFLLEAIDRLIARNPELVDTIEVHLAGVLTDADKEIASRSPVTRLHGYVTHADTVALLQSADLLFLPMQDLPAGVRAGLVPGKTYEYLGVGRPVLAAVPDGDARDLLTEAGNAFLCRPKDVTAIAETLAARIAEWRRGVPPPLPSRDVIARYERRRQTEQLARVLDRAIAASRREESEVAHGAAQPVGPRLGDAS